MERLTAATLVALHSLCHRMALTPNEIQAVANRGSVLGPALWREAVRMLETADAAGDGSSIDLGFAALIYQWLGLRDEEQCLERYGLCVADALARDCRRLAIAALVVAGQQSPSARGTAEVRPLVIQAWCDRAHRLSASGGPESTSALIGAIEWILDACPPGDASTEKLRAEFTRLCEGVGDPDRALRAIRPRESTAAEPDTRIAINPGATLALSVLWAMTHQDALLSSELDLDIEIDRSPEEWKRVRTAVLVGNVTDIPVPTETARAWCTGEGLSETELRSCLAHDANGLVVTLLAVECLWGGVNNDDMPPEAIHQVIAVARIRRARVEGEYRPLEGERQNIWYEVHQGARRPETMERVALLHRLNALFERFARVDPTAFACVYLDRAAEAESLGRHELTRESLEEARRLLHGADDPEQAEYGHVCLAHHAWASGEASRAHAMLVELGSDRALELRRRIESREEDRTALRDAECDHVRRDSPESWCEVATAHFAAGHTIAAERCARRICREHPAYPLAWMTLACILHGYGRHRDAVEPARRAVSLAGDDPVTAALLARILGRIGRG